MSFLDFAPDPKQIRVLKFFLIATLVVGALAGAVARPLPVAIPSWTIAPLWTLSYGLMAVAGWLAWKRAGLKSPAFVFYVTQLVLNLAWRAWPMPLAGAALDVAMLVTLILFARRNWLAALTFLPCIAWILFISVPTNGL
ncbi:MAG TPA: TspO/MBR family protein [Rhizomicrobium sp.]|nr:TspO/MBR family protein [Rhizomicrobium sp.]